MKSIKNYFLLNKIIPKEIFFQKIMEISHLNNNLLILIIILIKKKILKI